MDNATKLDPEKIIETISTLEKRISDRFPDSGLRKVTNELLVLSEHTKENITYINRPNVSIRLFCYTIIIIGLTGLVSSAALVFSDAHINIPTTNLPFKDVLIIMEGMFNNLILIGGAFFFLATMESRIKRKRALKSLHKLRVISHVIDMHQLTKDPYVYDSNQTTKHSPKRSYTKFELQRYLDYCSEASALIAKAAALYAQSLPDEVIVSSVNEIESLTTGLSRKIWQKIRILENQIPQVVNNS